MLGWEFPPYNSGGLGVACQGLAEALSESDVEVLFVLPKRFPLDHQSIRLLFADGEGRFSVRQIDTALTPYIGSSEYIRSRRQNPSPLYGTDLFAEVHRYAREVCSIAQKETFDLIHAHDWLAYLAGIEVKRLTGKPLVLHVHATGVDQAGLGPADPRVYAIEQEAFHKADAIITVSHYTKHVVERYYSPQHSEKIHVVHNGVDPALHGGDGEDDLLALKRKGNKLVLFVGRLSLHKGPDYFLRAAKRVLSYYPNVYFIIGGSGEMEYQLIRQAGELGIGDRVLFVGFVRGAELDQVYRSADLYILPSVSEPFGITPLESLLHGTPVIVSKQSGVSEVLKHALKVDFWDVDEMANQIVAVLQNDSLKKQLGELGQHEAFGLTWKKAAEKCVTVYKKVLQTLESITRGR